MEIGNGHKIGTLDVCSVAYHAANISFTKSSNKIRVEKYFDNSLYDTLRVEWYSLGLKLHPMSEVVALPKHVSVPLGKRRQIKSILQSEHYIRITCSTNGLIYCMSGPSLKERAKYGSELSSKVVDSVEPEGGTSINYVRLNSEAKNPKKISKVVITPDAKITSNADNFMIIHTPTLSKATRLPDREKMKSSQKVDKEIYQHPLMLPMRTDTNLV